MPCNEGWFEIDTFVGLYQAFRNSIKFLSFELSFLLDVLIVVFSLKVNLVSIFSAKKTSPKGILFRSRVT